METSKKDIVEIVGIFAIVISLIFVGMQLKLERKVALAEQYFNRAESVKEDYRTALLNPEHFRSLEEDWARNAESHFFYDRDWEEMKQVREGTRRISSVETRWFEDRLQIVGYDNLYYQYKQGLIDRETWDGLRESMKRSMSSSDMTRDVFESGARPNIKPIIVEILKEIELEQ